MKIIPTTYEREDGVTIILQNRETNTWILRKIQGPAWFFHPVTREWECFLLIPNRDLTPFEMSFEQAMELLKTVERGD